MLSDDEQRLSTISHNLANVGTIAFKRQRAVSVPFQEHLVAYANEGFSLIEATLPGHLIQTDPSPGTLRSTSQPLDVAIEDGGFFEVKTPQGFAYTRRGDFHLDAEGQLVTHEGYPVMGRGGEIQLTTTEPVIDKSGVIFEKDQQVGQIKVVHFSNDETLSRLGSGLFTPTSDTQQDSAGNTKVRQGHLEASNVSSMEEMVRLIETMRHFEAAQKIVQGYDDMMDKALKKFGEF
jgi:flagellar basal-body rod protein FlgG